MSEQKADLKIDGKDDIELPIISGTLGPDVLDVGELTTKGFFTYDPGFVSTAACESQITYIDGANGVLLHRGYPIDQLRIPIIWRSAIYCCMASCPRSSKERNSSAR